MKKHWLLFLILFAVITGTIFYMTKSSWIKENNVPLSEGGNVKDSEVINSKDDNESVNSNEGVKKNGSVEEVIDTEDKSLNIVIKEGNTIEERFNVPEGFERISCQEGSFSQYLRKLPLKPHDSKVLYFDGREKYRNVYDAVLDIDVGERDLQQCADAVMRLRAEYFYARKEYEKIHFNFTNGFVADYPTWMNGNRISVNGNNVKWVRRSQYKEDYQSFREYMDMVFAYAGTESLSQELDSVQIQEMKIGDVFMKGSLPGHCVIVVDMARNTSTNETIFMIAQSYMPAQDIHILKGQEGMSPWYSLDLGDELHTPEWMFTKDQLMRFKD